MCLLVYFHFVVKKTKNNNNNKNIHKRKKKKTEKKKKEKKRKERSDNYSRFYEPSISLWAAVVGFREDRGGRNCKKMEFFGFLFDIGLKLLILFP